MGAQWFYKVMGQEAGPISTSELTDLAQSGFLTPDVLIRKGPRGPWFAAGQLQGLFGSGSLAGAMLEAECVGFGPSHPPEGARPDDRSAPQPGTAQKPPPARLGKRDIPDLPDRPDSGTREIGPIARAVPELAHRPPLVPDAPATECWYCQAMGKQIGPLSLAALRELAAAGFLSPDMPVRKATGGEWIAASRVTGLLDGSPSHVEEASRVEEASHVEEHKPEAQAAPRTALRESRTASPASHAKAQATAEPKGIRSVAPDRADVAQPSGPSEVAQPSGLSEVAQPSGLSEVAQPSGLSDAAQPSRLSDTGDASATNAAETGWYCHLEGKRTGPLTVAELKQLVRSGTVTPNTLVRKGEEGVWLTARRIKGLFDPPGASPGPKQAKRPSSASPATAPPTPPAPPPRLQPSPKPQAKPSASPKPPAAPAPAAGPPHDFADFLDEALHQPLPAAHAPVDPFGPPTSALPSRPHTPRYSASPAFAEDARRPSRGAPGAVSRTLVGGFMLFIGGLGLVAAAGLLVLIVAGLVLGGSQLASSFHEASSQSGGMLRVGMLIQLAVLAVAACACYFYLSGGIGILRGQAAGAEKGATASAMALAIVGIELVWSIISVAAFGQQAGIPSERIGEVIGAAIFGAVLRSVMPAALLFWCAKYGPRMRR